MTTGSTGQRSGDVVSGYVTEQVRQIRVNDGLVRRDAPESVHDMRVATRRLRSALTTFRPVFRGAAVRPLGAELVWLSGRLGGARDAQVLRERLFDAVGDQASGGLDVAAVLRRVDAGTADSLRRAHDQLVAAMSSDRYRHLLTGLDGLTGARAYSSRATHPAGEILTHRTARAYSTLATLVDAAGRADGPDRDRALHDARKAAKRARYAGEALTGPCGPPAVRFAAAMKAVQANLGEHQDSIAARAYLEDLAGRETSPATAYVIGHLHALEQVRGDRAVERFEASWRAARKKSLRCWLR